LIVQLQYIAKMLTHYSNQEMADMYFMYDRANENASAAQRLYAKKFLNQRVPSPKVQKILPTSLRIRFI